MKTTLDYLPQAKQDELVDCMQAVAAMEKTRISHDLNLLSNNQRAVLVTLCQEKTKMAKK